MNFDDNAPLGEDFQLNPNDYYYNYVRNLNNEMLLSEFHINHLYILLLIRRNSPWDNIKSNPLTMKTQIESIVEKKVLDVKSLLQHIAKLYESKSKQANMNHIERLMNIIKAKNKSIFIERINQPHYHMCCRNDQNHSHSHQHQHQHSSQHNNHIQHHKKEIDDDKHKNQNDHDQNNKHRHQHEQAKPEQQSENIQKTNKEEKNQEKQPKQEKKQTISPQEEKHVHQIKQYEGQQTQNFDKGSDAKQKESPVLQEQDNQQQIKQQRKQQHKRQSKQQEKQQKQQSGNSDEIFGIFYGLSNIASLSVGSYSNCIDFNPVQKYIKFKMSQNYTMTIKSEDPFYYDNDSILKNVPADLFVHKIFPYLSASQLFQTRAVCKQWYQHVKQTWHNTFKREMLLQLLARQFCQQIQFHYKLVQLRNPFFQKLSLLLHALIEIIEWDKISEAVTNNTANLPIKRVILVLMKLIGLINIPLRNVNSMNQQLWNVHKEKVYTLKQNVQTFFTNMNFNPQLSIQDLRLLKTQVLDNPFMRVDQMNTDDKTNLLLSIFIKQLNLQQIIRRHISFAQEYLINVKNRLDTLSSKIPQKKGYLQSIYKILLLRPFSPKQQQDRTRSEMPNFTDLIKCIFQGVQTGQPDFVLKSRISVTNIYLDKATKLDIIVSTVKKMGLGSRKDHEQQEENTTQAQGEIKNQIQGNKQEQQIPKQGQENKEEQKQELEQNIKEEKSQGVQKHEEN